MSESTGFNSSFSDHIRSTIRTHAAKVMPGFLEMLNLYCTARYGKDVYTLLISSPCTLYKALVDLYKSERSAHAILKMMLKALAHREEDVEVLLEYMRMCRDSEFLELLRKILTK